MKKLTSLILIYTIFGLSTAAIAQDYKWEPLSPIKGIFADAGIGGNGFSMGVGGRFMFVGLNLALSGIGSSSPAYAHQYPVGVVINQNQPLPNGYEEERFMSGLINGDFIFYMDYFENLGFNVSLGFYSRNDTILAKKSDNGSRYIYRNVTESGLCYGLGAEYVLQESMNIGAGYHSQRGIVFRFTYLWF